MDDTTQDAPKAEGRHALGLLREADLVNRRLCSCLVRPAALADVGAMFNIRTSVRENALTVEELAQIGVTPETIASAIGKSACAWVAELQGEAVGFAMVDLEIACLFAVFVLPEHEGKGVGKRLIQVCEATLFEQHAVAWLETARNSRADGVYRSLGWGNERDVGDGDVRLEKRRSVDFR